MVSLHTPAPSTQGFIPPASTVKPGPSIKEFINDPVPAPKPTLPQQETPSTANPAPIPNPTPTPTPNPTSPSVVEQATEHQRDESVADEVFDESVDDVTVATSTDETVKPAMPANRPPADPNEDPEAFQQFWETMVESIFADVPTLHEPLKHYPPIRKDNVLIVHVKNDIQQNDFKLRSHQVLSYLVKNWDENLESVKVELDMDMETKKYILDDNDKIQGLREQNPDIVDFMKILNLRIRN